MQRSYVPNRQADGRVAGLFVLIRDITERRRTAEALHQAYQNLEQRCAERTAELTTLNDQFKREIHERSQVEARLREAKREAEQANLSKTKFLAAVSHDLLQPLNAARLFTSALQERGSAAQDNEALVNNISHSLEDVENLLGTLVDISKLDAGVITPDIAPFELGELLRQPGRGVPPGSRQRRATPGLRGLQGAGPQRPATARAESSATCFPTPSAIPARARAAGLPPASAAPVDRGLGHRGGHRRRQARRDFPGIQARRVTALSPGPRARPGIGDRRQDRPHARPPGPGRLAAGQGLMLRHRGTAGPPCPAQSRRAAGQRGRPARAPAWFAGVGAGQRCGDLRRHAHVARSLGLPGSDGAVGGRPGATGRQATMPRPTC